MIKLGVTDRRLLDEIQFRFPLCTRPFAVLGERLSLSEENVIKRLRKLKRDGVIRRIGPVFDARANRLATVLVALSVPDERISEATEIINALPGVTHNYLRRHELNIWFTLASRDPESQRAILRAIRKRVSPDRWLELPPRRLYKIGLQLRAGAPDNRMEAHPRRKPSRGKKRRPPSSVPEAGALIPFDLRIVETPFPRGAVKAVRLLRDSGNIRRFGAVLDEKGIGYHFSALVAWRVDRGREASVGERLASFPLVSHCYERERGRGWPYNLYTVVHERSRRAGLRMIGEMARAAEVSDYLVLETVSRLKRSSLRLSALTG